MTVSHRSHGFQAEVPNQPGDIARTATRGKDVKNTIVHPGMSAESTRGLHAGGRSAPTQSGAQQAPNSNPLTVKPPLQKLVNTKPLQATPGMRHRNGGNTLDDPQAMLGPCVKSGGKC